jgi:proline iminopeptidase
MTVPEFLTLPDHTRLALYRTGQPVASRALLAIAGGPGSDHRYLRVGPAFETIARHIPVVFYDQIGSGLSSPAGPDATIARFVEDIEAIRVHLGVARLDLLGHSFGGILLMAYATTYPERVNSLIFSSSMATKMAETPHAMDRMFPDKHPAWLEQRGKLPDEFPAETIETFQSMEFVSQKVFAGYAVEVRGHMYNIRLNNVLRADMGDHDYREQLKRITAPTLVLHGRWDAITAPKAGWDIHTAIPGSVFSVIEEAGHLPFTEKPAEYAAAVTRFLAAVPG